MATSLNSLPLGLGPSPSIASHSGQVTRLRSGQARSSRGTWAECQAVEALGPSAKQSRPLYVSIERIGQVLRVRAKKGVGTSPWAIGAYE